MTGRFYTLGLLVLTVCTGAYAQNCGPNGCPPRQGFSVYAYPSYLQPLMQSTCACGCPGDGSCGMPNCPQCLPASQTAGKPYADGWYDVAGTPDQKAKYVGGAWVGSWSESLGYYRSRDARGAWGNPVKARPVDLPMVGKAPSALTASPIKSIVTPTGQIVAADEKPILTGMDMWKQADEPSKANAKPKYSIGGEPVTEEVAYGALGAPSGLPVDKDLSWVLYFDRSPAKRDVMKKAFADSEALTPWRQKYRWKVEDPSDPNLVDREGHPSPYADPAGGLWLVSANGDPIGRLECEECETADDIAGALQLIDPQFDANAVRNLSKSNASTPEDDWTGLIVAAAIIVVLMVGAVGIAGVFALAAYFYSGDTNAPAVEQPRTGLEFAYGVD